MAFYLNVELENRAQVHKHQAKQTYGNFLRIGSFVGHLTAAVVEDDSLEQKLAEQTCARLRAGLDEGATVSVAFVQERRFGVHVILPFQRRVEHVPDMDFFALLAFCTGCSESDRQGSDQRIPRIGRRLALDLEQQLDTEGVPAHVHCRVSEHSQKTYVMGTTEVSIPSRHAVFYEDSDDSAQHAEHQPDEFKSAKVEQLRQLQREKPPELDVGGSHSRWAMSLSAREQHSERSWEGTPRRETDFVGAYANQNPTPAGQFSHFGGAMPRKSPRVAGQQVGAAMHASASDPRRRDPGARVEDVWADVWTSPRPGG
mmetsp:Transcript_49235/g.129971  ORF Transcript_49235/g.129971 Transcript_49235/m.129971 type:complete len:314 (-) Transcript_49235:271-1212(-)